MASSQKEEHMDEQKTESTAVTERTASRKLQFLKKQKIARKMKLTEARNSLDELVSTERVSIVSKTKTRFAIKKLNSELDIFENIVKNMKAVITVGDVEQKLGDLDELIDNLDKDMSEITQQAEQTIEMPNIIW